MPLRGRNHTSSVQDRDPYFTSLTALDSWADKHSNDKPLSGVLPFRARSLTEGQGHSRKGKLLTCHDYKGGYTEKPDGLAYTFNFWSYIDTFIYFAHHRITIPPSGWINAAHRNGVKMLGTIIFEHAESEPDCLRLLVGKLPQSPNGPAQPLPTSSMPLPSSPHYAKILADLAYQRGFDGWLLNIEVPLRGGFQQARALSTWIALLEDEMKARLGDHAEVIWYDSVVVNGELRWQDRLNNYNLPFFLPSTGFFTNYTWPPDYPSVTAQYFLSLDSQHIAHPRKRDTSKQLNDVYVGIDVWGRGQYGGGGLGSYKALSCIDPKSLGLSVALFGHAWTWESQQDEPGWTWDTWWAYERLLWIGPEDPTALPLVPNPPPTQGRRAVGDHGPFKPISHFFESKPPPNPSDLAFFTTFSPGVGRKWFVNGSKLWDGEEGGWTDVDKANLSVGLPWPVPLPTWHDMEPQDALPNITCALSMEDAWLGGSCLNLSLSLPGSQAEDAFFRCIWLPIQSLAISTGKAYTMTVVLKVGTGLEDNVELDIGLSLKIHQSESLQADVQVVPHPDSVDVGAGWQRLQIQFTVLSDISADISATAGLVIGFIVADPTNPVDASISLGAISVYPNTPSGFEEATPKIIWGDFKKAERSSSSTSPGTPFSGLLTWGTGVYHPPAAGAIPASPDDPHPLWLTSALAPAFLYFNVYVIAGPGGSGALPPEKATWIGTSGLNGVANSFFVDPACLPADTANASEVRFYAQGITDRGIIIPWTDCVFVDVYR